MATFDWTCSCPQALVWSDAVLSRADALPLSIGRALGGGSSKMLLNIWRPPMTKLNDLQLILLAAAAQREDGSLLPLPDHLADQVARIRKVIPPLIKQGLVEEASTIDQVKSWREEGDERFSLFITTAGRLSIGNEDQPAQEDKPSNFPARIAPSKTDHVRSRNLSYSDLSSGYTNIAVIRGLQQHF